MDLPAMPLHAIAVNRRAGMRGTYEYDKTARVRNRASCFRCPTALLRLACCLSLRPWDELARTDLAREAGPRWTPGVGAGIGAPRAKDWHADRMNRA